MEISSHELAAFVETAKARNMTVAARVLLITQSALSQRIQKLESQLETTLFIRERSGLRLSEAGQKLLRFALNVKGVEQEFLGNLKSEKDELVGVVRIAAYSSILRSLLIPSLAPFLRRHPKVQCEFKSYEVNELEAVLERAEADFVIQDSRLNRSHIEEHLLGREEYVVVQSSKHQSRQDTLLDHAPEDNATAAFFAHQKNPPQSYQRAFMGDVYAILDAVDLGLGKAVMSEHLLKGKKSVSLVKGFRPYHREIVLHHFKQAYVPRLHKALVEELKQQFAAHLKSATS